MLTRLPLPYRVPPLVAAQFLAESFPDEVLILPAAVERRLVSIFRERGISGGSVYDGLVALTAAENGAELLSLDRRAAETYRRCGVNYRLLE